MVVDVLHPGKATVSKADVSASKDCLDIFLILRTFSMTKLNNG